MRGKLKPGEYWVWCQRSGFKVPSSEIVREWNGLLVWNRFAEARHPQDMVKGVKDDQSVPFGNPRPTDVFLDTNEVTSDDL